MLEYLSILRVSYSMNNINNFNSYIDIQKLEDERAGVEEVNIQQTSWLNSSTKKFVDIDGMNPDLFAQIAGNGQVLSENKDPDLLKYLKSYFKEYCETHLEDSFFSESMKEKIRNFSHLINRPFVLNLENLKNALEIDKTVLIPVTKNKVTYFIKLEEGVGVSLFDADQNGRSDILIKQGLNRLTKELQYDSKMATELFFPKKNFDETFLSILVEAIEDAHHDKKKILEILDEEIGNYQVKDLGEATFKKGERSAICSEMKSFSFAFQSALMQEKEEFSEGIQAYKVMMFYLQFHSMASLWKKEGSQLEGKDLITFEDTLANLARRAEKLQVDGFLPDHDTNGLLTTLRQIGSEIEKRRQTKKSGVQVTPINPLLGPVNSALTLSNYAQSLYSKGSAPLSTTSPVRLPSLTSKISDRKIYAPLTDPKKALSTLKEILTHFDRNFFYEFMKTFPTPIRGNDSFWKKIPKEDRLELMTTLKNLMYSVADTYLSSQQVVVYYQLLSVIDQMAKEEEPLFNEAPSIFMDKFLRTIRSPHFSLEAPFQKKLNEVVSYLLKEVSTETFSLMKVKDSVKIDKSYFENQQAKTLFGALVYNEIPTFSKVEENQTLSFYLKFIASQKPETKELCLEAVKKEKNDRVAGKIRAANYNINNFRLSLDRFKDKLQRNKDNLPAIQSELKKSEGLSLSQNRKLSELYIQNEKLTREIANLKRKNNPLKNSDEIEQKEEEIRNLNLAREQNLSDELYSEFLRIKTIVVNTTNEIDQLDREIKAIEKQKIPALEDEIRQLESEQKQIGLLTFQQLTPLEMATGALFLSKDRGFSPILYEYQEATLRADSYLNVGYYRRQQTPSPLFSSYFYDEKKKGYIFTRRQDNVQNNLDLKQHDHYQKINDRDVHLENYQVANPETHYDPMYVIALNEFNEISDGYRGEAARLLAFCKKYGRHLHDFKEIIEHKFLRMNRLSDQIEEAPAFADEISKFFIKAIENYIEEEDVELALYFGNLGTKIAPFLNKEKKESFVKDLRDVLLNKVLHSVQEKKKIDVLEAVLKLYPEVSFVSLQLGQEPPLSFLVDVTLQGVLSQEMGQKNCTAMLLKEELKPFITKNKVKILQQVVPLKTRGVRTYDPSLFNFDENNFTLTEKKGGAVTGLSEEIARHPIFKELIGTNTFQALGLVTGWHQVLVDSTIYGFRIENGELLVYKEDEFGLSFLQTDFKTELCSNYPTVLNTEMTFWRRHNEKKIEGYSEGKLKVEIELDHANGVTKLIDVSTQETIFPFSFFKKGLERLLHFEKDPLFIECRQKNQDFFIHLPRVGLSFEKKIVNGVERLYSKKHKGYYLVKSEGIEDISKKDQEKCLLLANDAGNKKVIFPVNEAEHQSFFTLSIVDGEFKASEDVLSQLELAKIYYNQGKFIDGLAALKDLREFNRFSPREIEGFRELVQVILKYGNNHSLAVTSVLKIVVQLESNHRRFSPSEKDEKYKIIPENQVILLYASYSINRGNIGESALTPREEKLLLDNLSLESLSSVDDSLSQKAYLKMYKYALKRIFQTKKDFIEGKKVPLFEKYFSLPIDTKFDEINIKLIGRKIIKEKFNVCIEDVYSYKNADDLYTIKSNRLMNYILKDENSFDAHFVDYYRLAIEGTVKDREKLLKIISLNDRFQTINSRKFGKILKDVCQNPKSYYSFQEMIEFYGEHAKAHLQKEKFTILATSENDNIRKASYEREAVKWGLEEKKYLNLYNKAFSPITRGFYINFIEVIKEVAKVAKALFVFLKLGIKSISPTFFAKKGVRPLPRASVSLKFSKEHIQEMVNRDKAVEKRLEEEFVKRYFTSKTQLKNLPFPQSTNEGLKTYVNDENKTEETLYRIDDVALSQLKREIEEEYLREKERLEAQKVSFLFHLNGFFIEEGSQTKKLHHMGQRRELTFADLQRLFLKGSESEILEKTAYSKQTAVQVMTAFGEHLMALSRNQRLGRVLDRIRDYEAVKTDKGSLHDLEECSQRIAEQLLEKRSSIKGSFDVADRVQLSFECAQNLLYRSEQVDKIKAIIDALNGHRDVLVEMRTGAGKTNLMTPDLTVKLAAFAKQLKGEYLVVNVWPGASEMVNTRGLHKQRQEAVKSSVDRFTFDRNSHFTVSSLRFMVDELHKGLEEGIPLNMRPESMRALDLHYKLLLDECVTKKMSYSDKQEHLEKIELFRQILLFFRTKCVAVIDEQHVNLCPLDHMVYTSGARTSIPSNQVAVVESIFRFLEEHESLIKYKSNKQCHLTSEEYKKVAKDLAQKMYPKYQSQLMTQAQFESFVLDPLDDGLKQWVEKHPLKEDICLIRGYLSTILPATLKGSVDESFGLSERHLKNKPYAVVYEGSDTPKENEITPSQFKVVEKTLAATYLTYLYKGLNEAQFIELFDKLKNDLLKKTDSGLNPVDTEPYKIYENLFEGQGVKEQIGKVPLKNLTEAHIKVLAKTKGDNRELIYYFIRNIVIPRLNCFEETYMNTVQDFRMMFAKEISQSATPLSKDTHAPETKDIPDKTTSLKAMHLMFTKAHANVFVPDNRQDLFVQFEQYINKNGNIMSFFDVAALFKGKKNLSIANRFADIYKNNKAIESVIFFDNESKEFRVLDKATRQVAVFDKESHDPKKCFVFLDQNRSYGTDIQMPMTGQAFVSVGESTTTEEVKQGMGRLREIHKKQSFHFILEPETAKKMDKVTPEGVIEHIEKNQEIKRRQGNFDSKKQQMDTVLRSALSDRLLSYSANKAVSYFKNYARPEFVKVETLDPIAKYGASCVSLKPEPVLQRSSESVKKRIGRCNFSLLQKMRLRAEVEKIYKKKVDLPDKIMASSDHNQDVQVQQHEQQEVREVISTSPRQNPHYLRPWGHAIDPFTFEWGAKVPEIKTGKMGLKIGLKAMEKSAHKEDPLRFDCPIEGVRMIFKDRKILAKYPTVEEFFDKELLVTNNFWQLKTQGEEKDEIPHELYSKGEKHLYYALIVQDPGEKPFVVMIDQNDMDYFAEKLVKNRKERRSNGRKVGIYDLDLNIMINQGFDHFEDDFLKKDKTLASLIVQVKFLSGRVNRYLKEEEDMMDWIFGSKPKINRNNLIKFFEERILNETERIETFRDSQLCKMIKRKGAVT